VERGNNFFELVNHLGNVLATVSDKKRAVQNGTTGIVSHFVAEVVTANDYYSFGMTMPGRKFSTTAGAYRYGFNGKEKDNSTGNDNYDFGARIYDGRIGRWLSVDPLKERYPGLSPYNYVANSPISAIDPDGRLIIFINGLWGAGDVNSPNKAYWGNDWLTAAKDRIGDQHAYYIDGSLGGAANLGVSAEEYTRRAAGYAAGNAQAKNLILMLHKDANGVIDETIKFVTNSMGAAYQRGYSMGIIKYVKEENTRITKNNAALDEQIGQLQADNAYQNLFVIKGEPLMSAKNTPEQIAAHKKVLSNNSKIKELQSQKQQLLNVRIEFVVDLDAHQTDYKDENAENSYYMISNPSDRNIAERIFVSPQRVKGATQLGRNPDGSSRMRGHHSSYAPTQDLPESESKTKKPGGP
jgi:RHS repeat-associated protein